jgi:hypothetical protein
MLLSLALPAVWEWHLHAPSRSAIATWFSSPAPRNRFTHWPLNCAGPSRFAVIAIELDLGLERRTFSRNNSPVAAFRSSYSSTVLEFTLRPRRCGGVGGLSKKIMKRHIQAEWLCRQCRQSLHRWLRRTGQETSPIRGNAPLRPVLPKPKVELVRWDSNPGILRSANNLGRTS